MRNATYKFTAPNNGCQVTLTVTRPIWNGQTDRDQERDWLTFANELALNVQGILADRHPLAKVAR